jgi:hypothetical protein
MPNCMFICKNINRIPHGKLVTAGKFCHRNYTARLHKNYRRGSTTQAVTHISLRPEYVTITNQFILTLR